MKRMRQLMSLTHTLNNWYHLVSSELKGSLSLPKELKIIIPLSAACLSFNIAQSNKISKTAMNVECTKLQFWSFQALKIFTAVSFVLTENLLSLKLANPIGCLFQEVTQKP